MMTYNVLGVSEFLRRLSNKLRLTNFSKVLLQSKFGICDKTLDCLTFLLKLIAIDMHQSIDKTGKVIKTLPSPAVTISYSFYANLETQNTFIRERRVYIFK